MVATWPRSPWLDETGAVKEGVVVTVLCSLAAQLARLVSPHAHKCSDLREKKETPPTEAQTSSARNQSSALWSRVCFTRVIRRQKNVTKERSKYEQTYDLTSLNHTVGRCFFRSELFGKILKHDSATGTFPLTDSSHVNVIQVSEVILSWKNSFLTCFCNVFQIIIIIIYHQSCE